MATTKEFAAFVCDQLRLAPDIVCRKMFGEYGVYSCGKMFAVICDNRLLVKPTEAGRKLMPDAPLEKPYPGGKSMLLVENLDDADFLCALTNATCAELPPPKPKRRKPSKTSDFPEKTPKDD
ncbi:MAG: TfoX/Sxy family protein [Butyricicoccus sp.]